MKSVKGNKKQLSDESNTSITNYKDEIIKLCNAYHE